MKIEWKSCFKVCVSIFLLYISILYWQPLAGFVFSLLGAAIPLFIGCGFAFLLNILMEKLEIPRIEREPVDYCVPYHDTDELIEMGLIKVVVPTGVKLDENTQTVKADIQELITGEPSASAEDEPEEPTPEETPVEVPGEEFIMAGGDE